MLVNFAAINSSIFWHNLIYTNHITVVYMFTAFYQVCFGYYGFAHNWMTLNFSYVEDSQLLARRRGFSIQLQPYDGRYAYYCTENV